MNMLLAAAILAAQGEGDNAMTIDAPIPVVISTDCGTDIDDAWTVAYAAVSPAIDLLGCIGNHAPNGISGQVARDNVVEVLADVLGMEEHPPVYAGADGPLPDPSTPLETDGVSFLVEVSRSFTSTSRLTVLVIGSHTDLASAILVDPGIVDRIRVVMMGFESWPGGGDGWNVKNDVPAARIVLESGVPLTVGPADVCIRRLSFTTESCREFIGDSGTAGEWLAEGFEAWPHRLDGDPPVWPIWDNIVIAHILGLTRTIETHRPRLLDDLTFDHSDPSGQLTWVVDLDGDAMWHDFRACVEEAQ
ncbi:MAG: hypothetical protein GF320_07170 [Armatimonadia bacterium]|nr:hypothetical protein [Armatimonadia bacterium]